MSSTWANFFLNSLINIVQEDRAEIVLRSTGLRERWLHGQLLRLGVKESNLEHEVRLQCGDTKARFDFVDQTADWPMIAELKVIAPDHMEKMIDGRGNLRRFSLDAEGIFKTTPENWRCHHANEGSLFRDAWRLHNAKLLPSTERLLILVITDPNESSLLGRLLNRVEFGSRAQQAFWPSKRNPAYLFRIWKIPSLA